MLPSRLFADVPLDAGREVSAMVRDGYALAFLDELDVRSGLADDDPSFPF